MTQHTFIVGGSGAFPTDMLRHDECWPVATLDALAVGLECSNLRARQSRRIVKLATSRPFTPSVGRWESFGWIVLTYGTGTMGSRHRLDPDEAAINIERFLYP